MKNKYPRVRIYAARSGHLVVKDSLSLTFFIRHSHEEIAQGIRRSLERYLLAVGQDKLTSYADPDGYWQALGTSEWVIIKNNLQRPLRASIHLTGSEDNPHGYCFDYEGRRLSGSFFDQMPGAVSAVSFWLPTEYIEEQGPERVRELAMELASQLPFCSGYVGLSFTPGASLYGPSDELIGLIARHPGMDVPNMSWLSLHIGTHVREPSWLTFLGPSLLDELGGASALRARLQSPNTTVQEMEGGRAVVTLGPEPEAGDLEQGQTLPAYRELARVLEPWLFHEPRLHATDDMTLKRRWERRFLD